MVASNKNSYYKDNIVKSFQEFISNINISIQKLSFVNSFLVLSIPIHRQWFSNWSIWRIDKTLTSTTIPGKREHDRNYIEGIFHTNHSSRTGVIQPDVIWYQIKDISFFRSVSSALTPLQKKHSAYSKLSNWDTIFVKTLLYWKAIEKLNVCFCASCFLSPRTLPNFPISQSTQ